MIVNMWLFENYSEILWENTLYILLFLEGKRHMKTFCQILHYDD